MRIKIIHATSYTYAIPVRSILQLLRVTPRPHAGQQVVNWRLNADADVRLRWTEDPFGNIVHCLSTERPVDRLTLTVTGEIATTDSAGVVGGAVERMPRAVYLRHTPRTRADDAIADLARAADPGTEAGDLARLHALMGAVAGAVSFDVGATDVGTSAADALKLGRGVCQDLAHVFISAARVLGIPARYVSGHLLRTDGAEQVASHAWAEADVPGLGWVGFDPTNGVCPTESYVRIAIGLDYLDAAPVRGARDGGGVETMAVDLKVAPGREPMGQRQAQGGQVQTMGGMRQSQSHQTQSQQMQSQQMRA